MGKNKGKQKAKLRQKTLLDLSAPGHNYWGPGNPMEGEPTTRYDAFAQEHDQDTNYEYTAWQNSDEKLLNQINKHEPEDIWEWGGRKYFRIKKKLAERGIIRTRKEPVIIKSAMPKKTEAVYDPATDTWDIQIKDEPDTSEERGTKRLRSGEPIPPTEQPTLMATANVGTQTSRSRASGNETDVDPFTNACIKPWPMTQNCIMPYYETGTLAITGLDAANNTIKLTYRLNSIYDVKGETTFVADPAATADTTTISTIEQPQYRNYWSSIYQYWTVVKSEWTMVFYSGDSSPDRNADVYRYYHGIQEPPSYESGNITIRNKYRRLHPNVEHQKIMPRRTDEILLDNGAKFSGTYYPGMIDNQVAEDELNQTWHKTAEVPPLREKVSFIIQPAENAGATGTPLASIYYEFNIRYFVQWKDIIVQLEYTTAASAFPAVAAYAAQV